MYVQSATLFLISGLSTVNSHMLDRRPYMFVFKKTIKKAINSRLFILLIQLIIIISLAPIFFQD